jgi:salicylate hydroxylase
MLEPSDSVPIALKVIVVGGGLCGLATAIAVSLAGHKVTVFEASNRVHPFGSGLQSSPNGTRLFSKWGLDEILKPAVTAPKSLQIHSCDGALLARRDNFDVDTAGQYSSPLWTVHRVDLQASLLRRAIKLGVKIQFSSPVTDVDNDSLEIQLASGAKHRGDLVVIASGTWSDALRSKVLGRTVDADPTNETAYRINIDPKGVRDEELLELIGSSQIRIWIGPGSYAIGYPVRGSTQFCILFVLSDDFHKIHSIPVSAIDELRMRLQNWDPM